MTRPSQEIDELTLRRAQRGDSDAAAALVTMYQARVFGLCLRVLGGGDRAMAEDAAQETFIDVFAQLKKFSHLGSARLSSWVLTIAARRSVDMVRSRAAQQRLIDNSKHVVSQATTSNDDITAALHDLSAEHRAILILCDVYEFSYDEVSKALGLEVGTVKSRLARARDAARNSIANMRQHDNQARPA
jgi:RNA polymerase sigma-70 factor, ECF subfamily